MFTTTSGSLYNEKSRFCGDLPTAAIKFQYLYYYCRGIVDRILEISFSSSSQWRHTELYWLLSLANLCRRCRRGLTRGCVEHICFSFIHSSLLLVMRKFHGVSSVLLLPHTRQRNSGQSDHLLVYLLCRYPPLSFSHTKCLLARTRGYLRTERRTGLFQVESSSSAVRLQMIYLWLYK